MIIKTKEHKLAIALRMKGFSYREILNKVPVAKSTLSLWLRSVGLSKRQKQRLTLKRLEAAKRGADKKRNQRLTITREIKEKAKAEISRMNFNRNALWLMGIMLYWAEGTKEKEKGRSTGVKFSNSDPLMIKLFLKWLREICNIPSNHIKYELYIHENSANNLDGARKYWSSSLGVKLSNFHAVYFKKHNIISRRRNIGKDYYGQLNIRILKSTLLNRRIAGWIEGIVRNYWRVV